MPCIYKITNILTGHIYIGMTRKTAEERFEEHKKESLKGKTKLYKNMRKFGVDNFTVETLEYCEENLLCEKEIHFIQKLNPELNVTKGGNGGSTTHNKRWITNGEIDLYIDNTDSLPDGFRYGRTNCVFSDSEKQKEFNKRSDRKKAGRTNSEKWKTGENKFSEELLKQISERVSGDKNPFKRPEVRKIVSEKQKKNFEEKRKRGEKNASHLHVRIKCVHCQKESIISNIMRWHNDNCKFKNKDYEQQNICKEDK